jgi:hypothetical protein
MSSGHVLPHLCSTGRSILAPIIYQHTILRFSVTVFQTLNFYLNLPVHESLDYSKITLSKPPRPSYQEEKIGNRMERDMACGEYAWPFYASRFPSGDAVMSTPIPRQYHGKYKIRLITSFFLVHVFFWLTLPRHAQLGLSPLPAGSSYPTQVPTPRQTARQPGHRI